MGAINMEPTALQGYGGAGAPLSAGEGSRKPTAQKIEKPKNLMERHPMRTCKIVQLHCSMSGSESGGRTVCCPDASYAVMLALTSYMKPSPFSCSTHAPARSSDWS